MKTCIAAIASLNICIKAQRALLQEGIASKLVALDPSLTKRGCAYGLEFACDEERYVRSVFRRANISASQFINNVQGKPI